ncbi:MAG: hypothetical protein ACJAVF_003687 [Paraglaciecola sp.]|jgi:hypothetical protein
MRVEILAGGKIKSNKFSGTKNGTKCSEKDSNTSPDYRYIKKGIWVGKIVVF